MASNESSNSQHFSHSPHGNGAYGWKRFVAWSTTSTDLILAQRLPWHNVGQIQPLVVRLHLLPHATLHVEHPTVVCRVVIQVPFVVRQHVHQFLPNHRRYIFLKSRTVPRRNCQQSTRFPLDIGAIVVVPFERSVRRSNCRRSSMPAIVSKGRCYCQENNNLVPRA